MNLLQLITTLVPILSVFVFLVLLVLLRLPAKIAMPINWLLTTINAYSVWQPIASIETNAPLTSSISSS
ncbi:hypothetical protein [Pseudoalteromonas 'SMAR']|uniref:hypothetical protein n=1 Tax=Pseudoalteromonas 'SMAR' TaxID=3416908 RepID=UPI003AF28622